MKKIFFALFISMFQLFSETLGLNKDWVEFQNWKLSNQKTYKNSNYETNRFSIWLENRDNVNKHNAKYAAGLVTYKQQLNRFHDLNHEELEKFYGLKINAQKNTQDVKKIAAPSKPTTKKITTTTPKPTTIKITTTTPKPTTIKIKTTTPKPTTIKITTTTPKPTSKITNTTSKPTTKAITTTNTKSTTAFLKTLTTSIVDWRDVAGWVQPVKNQQACGSCWAFSAIASLESQQFNKTGISMNLSEQQLVDCLSPDGNGIGTGCSGGWMNTAFEYISYQGGVANQDSYWYVGVNQACKFKSSMIRATVKGYVDIDNNEVALLNAVKTIGPISVAIAAIQSFVSYKSGVYYDRNCNNNGLNHGVGYGTDPVGGDYWIVRNSWGIYWGDKGYILMARNRNNHCFISSYASYPLV